MQMRNTKTERETVFMEVHGYVGCLYRVTGRMKNGTMRYSVEIARHSGQTIERLADITDSLEQADALALDLLWSGQRRRV